MRGRGNMDGKIKTIVSICPQRTVTLGAGGMSLGLQNDPSDL